MKVLIDIQLYKIDFKMNFIDEYDKFIHHQQEVLQIYQSQVLAERMVIKDRAKKLAEKAEASVGIEDNMALEEPVQAEQQVTAN